MKDLHENYLRMAINAASHSPDPSTKNGAVLVARNGMVVRGCNDFPPRIRPRTERPEKYTYIEHAERRVIYQAAREGVVTEGAVLYCLWYACPECARSIVCAGIREVVGLLALDILTPERWRESVRVGKGILAEAGVRTRLFTEPIGLPVTFCDSRITV